MVQFVQAVQNVLNHLNGLNGLNASALGSRSFRRGPENPVRRQLDIQPFPAIASVAAHHEIAGASGARRVTARDIAEAGKEGARIRRMMDQGPDH